MAWQIAKPLGSGEVQETHLLAGIPKGAQPLGQEGFLHLLCRIPPCTRKESNTGFHPVNPARSRRLLDRFSAKSRGKIFPCFWHGEVI
jgi:hypothetical protein